ncbi:ATP-binding protein (plasmid) [Clostridium baratii]
MKKKYRFPIEYVEENIIFTHNDIFAGFKFGEFEYSSLTTDQKFDIRASLEELIKGIPSTAKILLVPRHEPCDQKIIPMINKISKDDPLLDTTKFLLESTIEELEERAKDRYEFDEELQENVFIPGDAEYHYDNYIFISIKDSVEEEFITRGGEILGYIAKDPVQGVNKFLGLADKYISDSRFRELKKRSNKFLEEHKRYFDIRSLAKREIDHLATRITKRGHQEADEILDYNYIDNIKVNEDGENVRIPYRERLKNRVEGKIKQGKRIIEVEHPEFTSYQSFIAVTGLPNLIFPGGEFIKAFQDRTSGIEICIDINKLSKDDSEKKINSTDKKLGQQILEADKGGHEVDSKTLEAKVAAEEFSKDIKENGHMLQVNITACIAGTNKKKVRSMTSDFVSYFKKDCKFGVINPYTDQYRLFLNFIPGTKPFNKDFQELMSIKTLAGGIFGSDDKLGDNKGVYIAYTKRGNKKVYLYMGRATQENKSPATVFFGNLGSGKSFNANLLTMLHVLTGSSAMIFDPKSERGHWKESFSFMDDLISIVRLTASDEDAGKLDPFNVYNDDINEACNLAKNIICELSDLKPNTEAYILLTETLNKMKNIKGASMKKLVELLDEVDENDKFKKSAILLSRQLKAMNSVGLNRLMFGDGTEKAINLDNRLNILQIDNLKVPEVSTPKADYSEEEKVSCCLMMIMGSFTKKFAMKKSKTFDITLFDESWFLKQTPEGRKLYDFLARQGRSLNNGCIFNGHSVLDVPSEVVKNTITYKFCFHTDSRDEAERMLEFMNKEVNEENIKMLMTLENREALFQDLDGRTGVIVFDAIFDMFIETFSTTPEDTLED